MSAATAETAGSAPAGGRAFLLPDVGEGLTEAEIVAWHVAAGDTVAVNQTLVEIETAKSVVELPSPYAGEVVELVAAEGETVAVGSPIIRIASEGAAPEGEGAASEGPASAQKPTSAEGAEAEGEENAEPRMLVGYGTSERAPRRRRRGAGAGDAGGADAGRADAGRADSGAAGGGESRAAATEAEASAPTKPRAKPPVRRLAKQLGVDLASVAPSGPDRIVQREDVLAAAQAGSAGSGGTGGEAGLEAGPGIGSEAGSGHTQGEETRIPIRGVRKHTAAAMVASAFTAPHVTEFVTVDVTRTLELREAILSRREFAGVKLSPLALVAKAYLAALAQVPVANGRWDEAAGEIVVPARVNLGIAAATPRGLLVPNIRAADRLGLRELALAIGELAETARAGKTPPEALAQGTTSITNIGVFGVDAGTPILPPGETAILAVGAIQRRPWVVDGPDGERIEPRSVLQLALSFDHRVIDGQQGSELLMRTAELLGEPGLALL